MAQTQDSQTLARSAAIQSRYDSILVHVEPGDLSSPRTKAAARLARAFDARLIGLGAEAIEPLPPADPYSGLLTAEWLTAVTAQVAADLESAEASFRRDAAGADIEWRSVRARPAHAMANTARAADLIVAGGSTAPTGDAYLKANAADLVLTSGRPVLIVPASGAPLEAKRIVVAWKDTREARRAVADALPFLVRAEQVEVLAICPADDVESAEAQASDVATALKRRGVEAKAVVVSAPDASVAEELNAEAAAIGADLIVAGGYGHSRMAEWILGGATRGLLHDPQRFVLLSH